jgi:hypothetical protein
MPFSEDALQSAVLHMSSSAMTHLSIVCLSRPWASGPSLRSSEFLSEFGKWRRSVIGKALQYHLESLSTAGSDLVERADFGLLEWVFREIMKVSLAVNNVLPVANHSEVADLRKDPVPLLEGIFAASQAGHK